MSMGSCHICRNEWYTLTSCLKVRRPMHIPTCPEGAIMAVCDECFDGSSSEDIIAATIRAYRKSNEAEGLPVRNTEDIRMTPTEHLLVEAAIAAWVPYMKGETTERPFPLEAISL